MCWGSKFMDVVRSKLVIIVVVLMKDDGEGLRGDG